LIFFRSSRTTSELPSGVNRPAESPAVPGGVLQVRAVQQKNDDFRVGAGGAARGRNACEAVDRGGGSARLRERMLFSVTLPKRAYGRELSQPYIVRSVGRGRERWLEKGVGKTAEFLGVSGRCPVVEGTDCPKRNRGEVCTARRAERQGQLRCRFVVLVRRVDRRRRRGGVGGLGRPAQAVVCRGKVCFGASPRPTGR